MMLPVILSLCLSASLALTKEADSQLHMMNETSTGTWKLVNTPRDMYDWHLHGNPPLTCVYDLTSRKEECKEDSSYVDYSTEGTEENSDNDDDALLDVGSDAGDGDVVPEATKSQPKFEAIKYEKELVKRVYKFLNTLFPKVIADRCRYLGGINRILDTKLADEERLLTVLVAILSSGLNSDTGDFAYDMAKLNAIRQLSSESGDKSDEDSKDEIAADAKKPTGTNVDDIVERIKKIAKISVSEDSASGDGGSLGKSYRFDARRQKRAHHEAHSGHDHKDKEGFPEYTPLFDRPSYEDLLFGLNQDYD